MKTINRNPLSVVKKVVNEITELQAKTYGPNADTILLSDGRNVDDSRRVAQDYESEDEIENQIIDHLRLAEEETYEKVKDGSTTCALIRNAVVSGLVGDGESFDGSKINKKEVDLVKKGCLEAIEQIKKSVKNIKTKPELYKIAYGAFSDEEVASLISEAVFKLGKEGVIKIEDSHNEKSHLVYKKGLEIDKGYVARELREGENETLSLKNPHVLLINGKILHRDEVGSIVSQVLASDNPNLVVIADDFDDDVIRAFISTKIKGLNSLLIETPGFADNKREMMKDIASITGGVISTNKTLPSLTLSDLDSCELVTATSRSTIFISNKTDKNERITELEKAVDDTKDKASKEKLEGRIAALRGNVAILKIGGYTEREQETKRFKAENSVNATQLAYKHGVVLGAGKTLTKIKTSSEVMNQALREPRKVLEQNGKEYLDEKVLDSAGVLISAIENGVSIALGLLKLGGVIAYKKEKKDKSDY